MVHLMEIFMIQEWEARGKEARKGKPFYISLQREIVMGIFKLRSD